MGAILGQLDLKRKHNFDFLQLRVDNTFLPWQCHTGRKKTINVER